MRSSLKFSSIVGAALLVSSGSAVPSMAQYQGPNGHYHSMSAYTRDINGTPCGMNCTRRAQQHWAHRYHHSHWNASYNNR
jgi:hypothetical protein